MAIEVDITERAAQRIVNELIDEGYVSRARVGRRNHYEIHPELPLRHPVERSHHIGELLRLLGPEAPPEVAASAQPREAARVTGAA